MQETQGRVLQDDIFGRGDGNLRLLDNVAVDAVDAQIGIRGDVAVAVVLAGLVDLLVAQVCQVGWRRGLGSAVAVAVEHVYAEDLFIAAAALCKSDGERRESESGEGEHDCET